MNIRGIINFTELMVRSSKYCNCSSLLTSIARIHLTTEVEIFRNFRSTHACAEKMAERSGPSKSNNQNGPAGKISEYFRISMIFENFKADTILFLF